MVQAAFIEPNDLILEIGPAKGNLTEVLIKTGAWVISVEKDKRFYNFLKEYFKDEKRLKIIQADIRDLFKRKKLGLKDLGYKLVANIPYYLTGYLFRLLYEVGPRPKIAVLMVQKEVGQRIIEGKSFLSLMLHYYTEPEIIGLVKKETFWPKPKVDSVILRLKSRRFKRDFKEERKFLELLKQGFGQPRKTLKNNLHAIIEPEKLSILFKELQIRPEARPADLDLKKWLKLYRLIYQK